MRLFLKLFGLHQSVPLHLYRHFVTQWMSKHPKGSPFYIFRHCDTVQKSHFNFFWEFFSSPQRAALQFFFIFCNQLEFHKARRVPPFTILSLRYSADFGRSRLVCFLQTTDFTLKSPLFTEFI